MDGTNSKASPAHIIIENGEAMEKESRSGSKGKKVEKGEQEGEGGGGRPTGRSVDVQPPSRKRFLTFDAFFPALIVLDRAGDE